MPRVGADGHRRQAQICGPRYHLTHAHATSLTSITTPCLNNVVQPITDSTVSKIGSGAQQQGQQSQAEQPVQEQPQHVPHDGGQRPAEQAQQAQQQHAPQQQQQIAPSTYQAQQQHQQGLQFQAELEAMDQARLRRLAEKNKKENTQAQEGGP